MKKIVFYVSLACVLALTLQSCPIAQSPTDAHTFIVSPEDSVEYRYYHNNDKKSPTSKTLAPSIYPQGMIWIADVWNKQYKQDEYHELHVRKLTNNAEAIVIEGSEVFINDSLCQYEDFKDPADTLYGPALPYALEDVIEQLELHYPNLVHRINDTEEHHFSNYKVSVDRSLMPRITLPKVNTYDN